MVAFCVDETLTTVYLYKHFMSVETYIHPHIYTQTLVFEFCLSFDLMKFIKKVLKSFNFIVLKEEENVVKHIGGSISFEVIRAFAMEAVNFRRAGRRGRQTGGLAVGNILR
ncbi:hypothetical protein DM860_003136 [Cuscuta australis]|uniref:Uncharacterized protein n=1 Tax=Cuscuta australis TaxID=267555 RepID=A0A328D6Q0_9ASTE|nr:hypothetical protein DM860_003136 [Cuscuta australis]